MGKALIVPDEGKKRKIFFILSAFLVWIYVLLRAKLLAVTWDEAWCFMMTIQGNHIFTGQFNEMAANNHYLGSMLMWISWKLFGDGEFVLRIPSLVGCAVYLFFVLKFISRIRSFLVAFFAFALFCLDPFILDFMGLARGYVLAMALMMASLWFLYSYVKEGNRPWKLLLSIFFSALGLSANLSLTTFFIAHSAVVLLLFLHGIFIDKVRRNIFPAVCTLLFSAGIVMITGWLELQFEKAGALGYGTYDGLWSGTVGTLLNGFFYLRHYAYAFETFMRSVIIVFLLLAVVSVVVYFQDEGWKKWNRSFVFILLFIFTIIILGIEALNYLFGVKFLMGRTAFPLVLMFCLVAVFAADDLVSETFRRMAVVLPLLFLLGHFCFCINLHYTFEWHKSADVKEILARIEEDLAQNPEPRAHNVRIGCDFPFLTALQYYDAIHHYQWMREVRFLDNKADPDLRYFVASEEAIRIFKDQPQWKIMTFFPEEKAALFCNTAYISPKE